MADAVIRACIEGMSRVADGSAGTVTGVFGPAQHIGGAVTATVNTATNTATTNAVNQSCLVMATSRECGIALSTGYTMAKGKTLQEANIFQRIERSDGASALAAEPT
jgi:hypothetical protein